MDERLDRALAAIPHHEELDAYDFAKVEAMVVGYASVWDQIDCEVLFVEKEFQAPLIDDFGFVVPGWLYAGKIDLGIRIGNRILLVDHKTSAEDFSVGSQYRDRIRMSGQASGYLYGARTLGLDPDGFVFDVLGKPALRPYGATQKRAVPETPADYRGRLLSELRGDPDRYYARIEIVRSESETRNYLGVAAADARLMDHVRASGGQTPNEDACFNYHTPCKFFGVCNGTISLEDVPLRAHVHSELAMPVPEGMRLLTSSRRSTFNACRLKHHLAYEDGYAPPTRNHSALLGDATHQALEAYWITRMEGR